MLASAHMQSLLVHVNENMYADMYMNTARIHVHVYKYPTLATLHVHSMRPNMRAGLSVMMIIS